MCSLIHPYKAVDPIIIARYKSHDDAPLIHARSDQLLLATRPCNNVVITITRTLPRCRIEDELVTSISHRKVWHIIDRRDRQ